MCIKLAVIKKLYYDARPTKYQDLQAGFIKFHNFYFSDINSSNSAGSYPEVEMIHMKPVTYRNTLLFMGNKKANKLNRNPV